MRINPITTRTIGFTADNIQAGWKYLTTGTTTKGSAFSLREGVQIRNIGTSTADAVISIEGITSGSFTSATGGVGFALAAQTEIFLPASDLSSIVIKTNSSTPVGITLAFIGY